MRTTDDGPGCTRRALVGAAAGLALALAGCGGGGEEPAQPGAAKGLEAARGKTLTIATMSDPYAKPLQQMAQEFARRTGATVRVDVLGYPELASKVRSDFIGRTGNYDLMTVDIVWTGEFAVKGWTVDLTPYMRRDAAEIQREDIMPVTWKLGGWQGKQVAYPFAGYANLLNYRTDLLRRVGAAPPRTVEQMRQIARRVTRRPNGPFGVVANGQQGAPVAQDWMAYNLQLGGSILGPDGRPALNSPRNVASLQFYASLFRCCTPPGSLDYDWAARETAFANGRAAFVETWSVSRASYEDPSTSKVAGEVGTMAAPPGQGQPARYAFGGWGLGINADSDAKDAAWEFVKWITSPAQQRRFVELGAGSYIRRSTLTDPKLLRTHPWQRDILVAFEKGDGDFRPRIPQYSQIEEIVGKAVSSVLTGGVPAQRALDQAQAEASKVLGG
jgi:multiple sugar transport system substrate-binding protein